MSKEDQIIMNLRDLYNKMAWLNNLKMKDCFDGYKSSEVHCVEYIGKNADSNVTKLAEAFYMTMRAASKLTKKLAAKWVIESYRNPAPRMFEEYYAYTEKMFHMLEFNVRETGVITRTRTNLASEKPELHTKLRNVGASLI